MNINVTKPFLPPQAEYQKYVQEIWAREWLTNNGPLVNELELRLKEWLRLDHLLFVSNGTIALQLAIKALNLTGEIITTPFSYVATTSSIVWENCVPVMADICPRTFNIDPARIEDRITDRTSAILATHVYGTPCDVEKIERIAQRHNLKVIYDAAHAFGTTYRGKSLFAFGDISTTSFHATKLFHTIEGGAIVTQEPEVLKVLSRMRNFGHVSPTAFDGVGINGKNSEFHAAMGLCNLKHIDDILRSRKTLSARYDESLRGLPIQRPQLPDNCGYNHAYYPVVFESEATNLAVIETLNLHSVFPRRYFFPSLGSLNYVNDTTPTPVCDDLAARVLCLPLYHSLSFEEIDMICRLIHRALKY
ncbi:DegT/DnrJ/EryC1/StrS family aminotransferase [Cupriavidus numazuensis]|uniref:dTDP-4-amino-4,6-dideoxy-D-glucose transaminase n=1 Tax=Cupriavidus numazuensis TaxID=221992 RepID=A0ABM8TRQ4_9BURK|nr:DegT/DnrJ/EryC1/StrS family aminotransferase [Cupriavidus numazuensis]CAG2158760.1 dTDP-4-amino-4,6-dideoxy-D-glucose transaminase [Cupriavidus numazuensis]